MSLTAICPNCQELTDLSVCYDCKQALCFSCIKNHFDQWKVQANKKSFSLSRNLEIIIKKLENIDPILNKNIETLENAECLVEQSYQSILKQLAQEKHDLLDSIKNIKNQNKKYKNFKNDVESANQSINSFRETNIIDQHNTVDSLTSKFENNNIKVEKIDQEFNIMQNSSLPILEKCEQLYQNFGNKKNICKLHESETKISSILECDKQSNIYNTMDPIKETMKLVTTSMLFEKKHELSNNKIYQQIYPTLSSNEVRGFALSLSQKPQIQTSKTFCTWKEKTSKEPDEKFYINIDFNPVHVCCFRNILFCMSENEKNENLLIFNITSNNKIELKNTFKLCVPNIKGISANYDYFGLSYSNLKSSELKQMLKNQKPSGVLLFKRDLNMICTIFDKVIEVPSGFKSPVGIALNNEYIFVCDKELKKIFKIHIQSGELISSVSIPNGEPYKCSINRNYIVITDILNHELKLYDIDLKNNLNNIIIEQEDNANGPYSVFITDDNIIIFKNYMESQIVLTNTEFSEQICFRHVKSSIFGITVLQCATQTLLLLASPSRKKHFKFISYSF